MALSYASMVNHFHWDSTLADTVLDWSHTGCGTLSTFLGAKTGGWAVCAQTRCYDSKRGVEETGVRDGVDGAEKPNYAAALFHQWNVRLLHTRRRAAAHCIESESGAIRPPQ